eukprot:s3110_g4.t1
MVTGRKYVGKVAMFGEKVLATANGEDLFRPGVWLGKTDRAGYHMVATVDGLRWTRTIRRLPVAYDAETLANVRTWPWNVDNNLCLALPAPAQQDDDQGDKQFRQGLDLLDEGRGDKEYVEGVEAPLKRDGEEIQSPTKSLKSSTSRKVPPVGEPSEQLDRVQLQRVIPKYVWQTRAWTSCGGTFIGGSWIYSYSSTQKCIILSSTEAEYSALVSGASEGLLVKAVAQHLTGETVDLKVYSGNTSCVAAAQKEGAGRVKHLDGRLLWLQQRPGKDLELRRLDTTTNPADLGTKCLPGWRVRFLPCLLGLSKTWDGLGKQEFQEEKTKKDGKERIRRIKAVVHPELAGAGEGRNGTLLIQAAKKLLRLTLFACLWS